MDLTILIPCKNDKINLIQVIKEIKINYPNIFILVIIENQWDTASRNLHH